MRNIATGTEATLAATRTRTTIIAPGDRPQTPEARRALHEAGRAALMETEDVFQTSASWAEADRRLRVLINQQEDPLYRRRFEEAVAAQMLRLDGLQRSDAPEALETTGHYAQILIRHGSDQPAGRPLVGGPRRRGGLEGTPRGRGVRGTRRDLRRLPVWRRVLSDSTRGRRHAGVPGHLRRRGHRGRHSPPGPRCEAITPTRQVALTMPFSQAHATASRAEPTPSFE